MTYPITLEEREIVPRARCGGEGAALSRERDLFLKSLGASPG